MSSASVLRATSAAQRDPRTTTELIHTLSSLSASCSVRCTGLPSSPAGLHVKARLIQDMVESTCLAFNFGIREATVTIMQYTDLIAGQQGEEKPACCAPSLLTLPQHAGASVCIALPNHRTCPVLWSITSGPRWRHLTLHLSPLNAERCVTTWRTEPLYLAALSSTLMVPCTPMAEGAWYHHHCASTQDCADSECWLKHLCFWGAQPGSTVVYGA